MDGQEVLFQDSLLENLTGEWKISRKMPNQIEENHARVEWILNHQFLQIHMVDVKSPPTYEALVLIGYEHENKRYVIYWLDVFGGRFSEKGFAPRSNAAALTSGIHRARPRDGARRAVQRCSRRISAQR